MACDCGASAGTLEKIVYKMTPEYLHIKNTWGSTALDCAVASGNTGAYLASIKSVVWDSEHLVQRTR